MLFALLAACTPAFDQTRKDLQDFRLVALAAQDGQLNALVWSGEGAFHSTAPTVVWEIDGIEVTSAPPAPFVARARVTDAGGRAEEGELLVESDATNPTVSGFTRSVDGDTASLSLDTEAVTRWKGSSGTFTETGPASADWSADEAPLAAIVGLSLDGAGGVRWSWLDVATDAGAYIAVGGRLIPAETTVSAGDFLVTLTRDDNLAGVVLTDIAPAEEDPGESPCGLEPFDADALADGRCGLDEAAGARVRITAGIWP